MRVASPVVQSVDLVVGALLVDDAEFDAAGYDEAVADIEKYFVTIYLQSGYKYATEMIEGDDPEKAQVQPCIVEPG